MATFSRVTLIGYLTKDVQLHNNDPDKPVAKTRMAFHNWRRDRNGDSMKRPVFIDVSLFGRNAEVAHQHARKGSQVFVEGRLEMYEWEDGGTRRQKYSVAATDFRLLGRSDDASEAEAAADQHPAADNGVDLYDAVDAEEPALGSEPPL